MAGREEDGHVVVCGSISPSPSSFLEGGEGSREGTYVSQPYADTTQGFLPLRACLKSPKTGTLGRFGVPLRVASIPVNPSKSLKPISNESIIRQLWTLFRQPLNEFDASACQFAFTGSNPTHSLGKFNAACAAASLATGTRYGEQLT